MKLDMINDRLGSIDVTLAKQHESLEHHIKRTDILENELKPLREHVAVVNGGMKLIGFIGATIAFMAAMAEILGYFKK